MAQPALDLDAALSHAQESHHSRESWLKLLRKVSVPHHASSVDLKAASPRARRSPIVSRNDGKLTVLCGWFTLVLEGTAQWTEADEWALVRYAAAMEGDAYREWYDLDELRARTILDGGLQQRREWPFVSLHARRTEARRYPSSTWSWWSQHSDGNHCLVVLGDVLGRGQAAARTQGMVQATLNLLQPRYLDPVDLMAACETELMPQGTAPVSLVLVALTARRGRVSCRVAHAGIVPAVLLSDGQARVVAEPSRPLFTTRSPLAVSEFELQPNEALLVATKGALSAASPVSEAVSDYLASAQRAAHLGPELVVDTLTRLAATTGESPGDDAVVMSISPGRHLRAL